MFVGVQNYSGNRHKWAIDIWITNKREYTGFDNIRIFDENLSEIQRKLIIELKEYYDSKSMLNNGFSTIIYEAVLKANVRSKLEFDEFLLKR